MSSDKKIAMNDWEIVIGLEVHVQLATNSKLFSGASVAFGLPPNSQANLIDAAIPGTLPVLNKTALDLAIMFGVAIGATIPKKTEFVRKNYFYPDLPKGYQISQMNEPIVQGGFIPIYLGNGIKKNINIHHAHLEEDAGKSIHTDCSQYSQIDLNRAGTPLLEIVTNPDFTCANEVTTYLKFLNCLLRYLKVSDGDLSQGSMRCDVNLSVRPKGISELGTRTEIKNLNSYRFIEQAIDYESRRQITSLLQGKKIAAETRLYDPSAKKTKTMRSKESVFDYRYFPCPDLLPVEISTHKIEKISSQLPELPNAKLEKYTNEFNLKFEDAFRIATDFEASNYFDECISNGASPKFVVNLMFGEITAYLKKNDLKLPQYPVFPKQIAELSIMLDENRLSSYNLKKVLEILTKKEKNNLNIQKIVSDLSLNSESDQKIISNCIQTILTNNPKQVNNYLNAPKEKQQKMIGFFVGQVMKISGGKADPKTTKVLLENIILNYKK